MAESVFEEASPGPAQWVTRSGKPQMVQLAFYDQEGRNGL